MIKTIKAIYRFVIPKSVRIIIYKIIPKSVRRIRNNIVEFYLMKTQPKRHKKALEVVKKKDKIKVAFFLIHDSVWKYEGVYKLMKDDDRFDPIVVVCPYIVFSRETMLYEMNKAYENFKIKGYNVIKTLNEETGEWLNVKKGIKPDIVFFSNPYKLTKDEYYITNFRDTLTCYVPYAFVVIHSIEMHYNQFFHHVLWNHFVETKYHKKFAMRYTKSTTSNIHITGYPSLDRIHLADYKPSIVWKEFDDNSAKRIIWAPHHAIEGQGSGLDYSCFVNYSEYFFELLESINNIQMAFKPHPLLKVKLYNDQDWGKEKTDAYFKKWDDLPNGQLEEGDYIDLFFTSDAMMLDSASFIAEYLYFDKPILFTMRDDNVKDRFNSFGRMVFNYMYTAKNSVEVENFIQDAVIKQNDFLKTGRNHFLNDTILPKNGKTASENIYYEIKRELC